VKFNKNTQEGPPPCHRPGRQSDVVLVFRGGNSDIKFTYSPATSTSLGADTDKLTLFAGPHFLYHTFVPISI